MERENRPFSSLCVRRMHTFRAETQPPDLIAARSGNKLISHSTPFSVENTVKIPKEYLGKEKFEHGFLVKKNEFIHGVLDKNQFVKYGLVHTVQELYGSDSAGSLSSGFSRLFTVFLQVCLFMLGKQSLTDLPYVFEFMCLCSFSARL